MPFPRVNGFGFHENPLTVSPFVGDNGTYYSPIPPDETGIITEDGIPIISENGLFLIIEISGLLNFLLLDNSQFLLLDGTNFDLLGD